MLEEVQKDCLTGFYLRDGLAAFCDNLMDEGKDKNSVFSIALLDLDHFKKFNDKYGHAFGDDILKYVGSIFRLTFYDTACQYFRYGGDEFIVVFPGKGPKEIFYLMRQCIYNMAHHPFLFKNKIYKVGLSSGIASFPKDGSDMEDLIKKADKAMYFSKRHGRNRVTLFNRISYLKIRNLGIMIAVICFSSLLGFMLYKITLKKIISYTLKEVKNVRIVTKPKDLDVVILKSGTIYEGYILEETAERIVLSLYLKKGEGTMVFNSSEISKIKYGQKNLSNKDGSI